MLYILDYGAGNVASLGSSRSSLSLAYSADPLPFPTANSVKSLGFEFKWVESVQDIEKADVRHLSTHPYPLYDIVSNASTQNSEIACREIASGTIR